ncbi:MAG: YfiR family protein [Gammaproteobacteria bacterium]
MRALPVFPPFRSLSPAQRPACNAATLAVLLLLLWMAAFPTRAAEEGTDLEQSVKAAFLYKFASFVEWPAPVMPQPATPITIAVAGSEKIVAELNQMVVGRTAQGHPITVRRIRAGDSLAGVHILFIGGTESARLGQWAEAAQTHSTLLVTDAESALTRGSMINFVLAERRVRFEISLDTAEKSGLKLSSRLLAVAQHVHRRAPP